MFRCGSSYQDRPCDAGQPAKVINRSGVSREQVPVAGSSKVDAECADRGTRAKQVVWAKESGKTADVQLSSATSDEDRKLVAEVYRRRGSSLDVSKGIEADCMADKDRAGQLAALLDAAARLKGQDAPAPIPAARPTEVRRAETPVPPAPPQAVLAGPDSADRLARCRALKGQLDALTAGQRAGGTITQMEQLNRQQQSAAKAWRDVGC